MAAISLFSTKSMNPPQKIDESSRKESVLNSLALRIVSMVLLFVARAMFEVKNLSSLSSPTGDGIWLHLRTGLWILQSHALPRTGLFSQSAGLPWTNANWGYDLLTALAFRVLQLRAIPALLMMASVGLAIITFLLAGGTRGRFWPALALSALAQWLLAKIPVGPANCAPIFFGVALLLLYEVRRARRNRLLLWLPPIFLLWANLDSQFGHGILLLLVFLASVAVESWLAVSADRREESRVALKSAGIAVASCLLATCITPYGYRPYAIFFASLSSSLNVYVPGMQAMGFRQPQDYALMLLAMTAFLALGLRRSRDPFEILLLVGCTILSFRAQRDIWLVVLVSIAVIGEALGSRLGPRNARRDLIPLKPAIVAGLASIFIAVAAVLFGIPPSKEVLLAKIAKAYPVLACDSIRSNKFSGTLFNPYEWGGFLAWYLPEYPVAIDSRAGLYPDEFVEQYFKAMNAEIPYQAFPPMNDADVLLLPRHSTMGEALRTLPIFRVEHEDDVALVLVKK